MSVTKVDVASYLKTYADMFSLSFKDNISLNEAFINLLSSGKTDITFDDFGDLFIYRQFFNVIKIIAACNDNVFFALLDKNVVDFDDTIFCTEEAKKSYTKKSAISLIRNALCHNDKDNPLYWFDKDEDGIKLHIKLNQTSATAGDDKGKVVPFEVKLSLAQLGHFQVHYATANYIHIGGIEVGLSARDGIGLSDEQKLQMLVDNTYYKSEIYKQLSDREKKGITGVNDIDTIKNIIGNRFVEYKKKKLGIMQKRTLVDNIKRWKTKSNGYFDVVDVFEYEALKILPISREKYKGYLSSILFINGCDPKRSVNDNLFRSFLSFRDNPDSNERDYYNRFCIHEPEEERMFGLALLDDDFLGVLNKSVFYGYMLDSVIQDEFIEIGGKQYPRAKLRNSFVHGRWFVDSDNDWHLYDCYSKKVADEFDFNFCKVIKDEELYIAMNKYYQREVSKQKNSSKV
jgi:hypothetical protein